MTSSLPAVPVTTSGGSRWCPTPEQVMLLEGMYRGGLKTPTATQIQQITSRLSIYGKIQGKNVFYWFQNHKARDRQKLRKKLMALYHQHRLYPTNYDPHHHQFLPLHPEMIGRVEDDVSKCKPMINNWKQMDPNLLLSHDHHHESTTSKLMCDCSLMTMMMMDHHHHDSDTTPHMITRVPPKTLQLFPLTTTDLKQEDADNDDDHSTTTSKP